MATIKQKIAEKFIENLSQSKNIDSNKINQLKAILLTGQKSKADDFVKIFLEPIGDDLA